MAVLTPFRLLALALALTGALALSAPSPALAADSCLDRILKDWYPDERIDGRYSQACYRAALNGLPQDLRDYSDLPAEIQSAKLRALRDERIAAGRDQSDRRLSGAGPVDARNNGGGTGGKSDGPIDNLLEAAGPSSADSAPIPLLVLAGLALLLIAAGATGVLTRKLNARRARSTTPPATPDV